MRYTKYLSVLFLGLILLPAFTAKSSEAVPVEDLDLKSVIFIESDYDHDLGFETEGYLPEGFNPFTDRISPEHINYVEEDEVELGFDTAEYLPSDFNAYK